MNDISLRATTESEGQMIGNELPNHATCQASDRSRDPLLHLPPRLPSSTLSSGLTRRPPPPSLARYPHLLYDWK
jgi:hypothetical protein